MNPARLPHLVRAATVVAILSIWGCGGPGDVAVADATAALQPPSCDPSTCTPSSRLDGRVAPEPFGIRLGTNDPTPAANTDSFSEAQPGGEIEVIFGQQFWWMVVLAAEVDFDSLPCCVDKVNIKASLTLSEGAVLLGELNFRRRPVAKAPDGFNYISNIFLAIKPDLLWDGQEAVLDVELEPYGGGKIVRSQVPVVLRQEKPLEEDP